MSDPIKDIAALLMYKGPEINSLVQEAVYNGSHYEVEQTPEGFTKLTVTSMTAYDLTITDIYTYNADEELVRQTVLLNGKEKVVFDKYEEANNILRKLEKTKQVAS